MGQRHQIYVKFPGKLGVAGFHHQWLYGMTAIESLSRVVEFHKNQGEYGPLKQDVAYGLDRQCDVITSLYSTDHITGYWHYVHNLLKEEDLGPISDPRNGDNNDGITVIDVSNGDFRYCFMSIGHLEGEVDPKPFVPLTAREYLLCYYPKFLDKKARQGKELDQETFDRVLHRLLLVEENSKVLTLAEVKKIFPNMFCKSKKAGAS